MCLCHLNENICECDLPSCLRSFLSLSMAVWIWSNDWSCDLLLLLICIDFSSTSFFTSSMISSSSSLTVTNLSSISSVIASYEGILEGLVRFPIEVITWCNSSVILVGLCTVYNQLQPLSASQRPWLLPYNAIIIPVNITLGGHRYTESLSHWVTEYCMYNEVLLA